MEFCICILVLPLLATCIIWSCSFFSDRVERGVSAEHEQH